MTAVTPALPAAQPARAASGKGAWARGWRLDFGGDSSDPLRQWLAKEWCVFDDGSLPRDAIVRLLPGSPQLEGAEPLARSSQTRSSPAHKSQTQTPQILMADGHRLTLDQRQLAPSGDPSRVEFTLHGREGGCRFVINQPGLTELFYWGANARVAVYTALCEIFRASGWFSIHASAVVDARYFTGAHMFLGRSGAGKSFTVLRAIAAGAQPIGEDRVWFSVQDQRLAARDDSVRVNPDAFKQFAWLDRARSSLDADGKHKIMFEHLGTAAAAPAPLHSFSILRLSNHPTALEMAAHLWEALGIPFSEPGKVMTERAIVSLMTKHGAAPVAFGIAANVERGGAL